MIGVHFDIPAARYHADDFGDVPTLSSSVVKLLLSRTPAHAWAAHPRLNVVDEVEDDGEGKFDLGSAAHEMILRRGGGIEVHEFDAWRSKAAKEARAASRAAGRVPMLRSQYDRAHEIARAAWAHPHALYAGGSAEVVLVWQDIGGPLCRAMLDHLHMLDSRTTIITDVKTTDMPLTDQALGRLIVNLGYDMSAAFYIRGLVALKPEMAGRIRWIWHFVETSAPFGSRMVEASPHMIEMGDRKAALSIATWGRCLRTGDWPAWSPEIERVELPAWVEAQQMEREMVWPDADAAVFTNTMAPRAPVALMGPI